MKTEVALRRIADNIENGSIWSEGLDMDDETAWQASLFLPMAESINLAPRTHMVNGFEVPAPETKAPEGNYFVANSGALEFYQDSGWTGHELDFRRLKRGLIHLTAEAAIANAKAMLGSDPYSEAE